MVIFARQQPVLGCRLSKTGVILQLTKDRHTIILPAQPEVAVYINLVTDGVATLVYEARVEPPGEPVAFTITPRFRIDKGDRIRFDRYRRSIGHRRDHRLTILP